MRLRLAAWVILALSACLGAAAAEPAFKLVWPTTPE